MSKQKLYIGVDLGGTNIQAGLVDETGEVYARDKTKTHADRGLDAVVERLVKLIKEVCEKGGYKPDKLEGLGIGAPGTIDVEKGLVTKAVNLRWDNVPLCEMLKRKLDVPVVLDNDVNVGAWGEYVCGAGRDYGDQLAVFVGTGVGGGLVINGKIYHGYHLTAGEIGHTVVNSTAGVGRRTLENLASRTSIVNLLTQLIKANHPSMLVKLTEGELDRIRSKILAQAYEENDALTMEVIRQAATHIGASVANAVTLLSLSCVVIGGGITEALGEPWVAEVKRAYRQFVFPADLQEVPIVASQLNDDAGVIGAALIAHDKLYGN